MKTQEDTIDALVARVEKRLLALESNVSHMKSKLAELQENQEEVPSKIFEQYKIVV